MIQTHKKHEYKNKGQMYRKITWLHLGGKVFETVNTTLCKIIGTLCAQILKHIIIVFYYNGSLFFGPVHSYVWPLFGFHPVALKYLLIKLFEIYTQDRDHKRKLKFDCDFIILELCICLHLCCIDTFLHIFFQNSICNIADLSNKQNYLSISLFYSRDQSLWG